MARIGNEPCRPTWSALSRDASALLGRARQWANELSRNDPELFRHLVPCDPVVTVAPDVVFFECFAKDESSYGCLSVDREAFRDVGHAGRARPTSTTRWRSTSTSRRCAPIAPRACWWIPTGFEVKVEGRGRLREEKIDLPASWLRGFGQIQAAMGLPARRSTCPCRARLLDARVSEAPPREERAAHRSIQVQAGPGRHRTLDPGAVGIPVSRGRAVRRRAAKRRSRCGVAAG